MCQAEGSEDGEASLSCQHLHCTVNLFILVSYSRVYPKDRATSLLLLCLLGH